jgi:ribulose-5-phosphate 4-epimerase/fuculose-1-phosphate aldolase
MSITGLPAEFIDDLVDGNHILFHHQVVDAFGHLSARHPDDPETYVMSRHLAPGLVTPDDLLVYDLNSVPVTPTAHRLYSERFIHGEIYKARPDVMAVVHCHAPALIPFGITATPLRPVYHMSGFIAEGVPVFEIRETAGMTDMLIRTAPIGRALAEKLGPKPMVLMRGHGATMAGRSTREAVYRAIYAAQNAAIQLEAIRLGEVMYLSPEEGANYDRYTLEVLHRPWNIWKQEIS